MKFYLKIFLQMLNFILIFMVMEKIIFTQKQIYQSML